MAANSIPVRAWNDAPTVQVKELLIGGTTHVALKRGHDVIVIDASKHPEILFEVSPDYDRWKKHSIR